MYAEGLDSEKYWALVPGAYRRSPFHGGDSTRGATQRIVEIPQTRNSSAFVVAEKYRALARTIYSLRAIEAERSMLRFPTAKEENRCGKSYSLIAEYRN